MGVEIFDRPTFEATLPRDRKTKEQLWQYAGFKMGEHVYHVPVRGTNKRIVIRSSIGKSGLSDRTGENSIRFFVQYYYKKAERWCTLGKGQKTLYTTRVTGWQGRLTEGLHDCWELAVEDSKRHGSYKPNDQVPAPQAPQPPAQPTQHLETAAEVAQLERLRSAEVKMSAKDAAEWQARQSRLSSDPATRSEPKAKRDPGAQSEPKSLSDPMSQSVPPPLPFGDRVNLADNGDEEEPNCESDPTQKREPNPGQKEAIEAPVHAALRCLAGPGSGKTWTLENRVAFLLDHDVKPENLLAVTFSKPMADEMLGRIATRNPSLRGTAAEKQISTIHACCFRILRAEGDRRKVLDKDWMIKRILNGDRDLPSIIEAIWPYADDRPGWKDAYRWICLAKFYGLTTSEDLEFYEKRLGYNLGTKLHEARKRFDQTLASRQGHPKGGQGITFLDMLLDVEVQLRRDRAFREKWQQRFKWVLIDEGQDTTAQAMRILATLAEPQNQVLIVGDGDQCVLEGELVLTPSGYKSIEEIKKYDKVVAAIGKSKSAHRFVLGTSKKNIGTWVVVVETKSGRRMRVTHNHMCFAAIPSYSTHTRHTNPDAHYVYLMYKRGYGYRIGVSKNPRQRLLGEHADKLWLIRIHDNARDAYYDENLLAAQYGIPTMTFVDHKTGGKTQRLDQEYIDRLFAELCTVPHVEYFASQEGFLFDRCPHLVAQGHEERIVAHVTMCAPRNTRTPTHEIGIETSNLDAIRGLLDAGVPLTCSKTGRRFRFRSTSVREIQKTTSLLEGQIGCEVVVKGSFISKEDMGGSYSLTPQMMPAGNILPGFLVPVVSSTTGRISLEEVIRVDKYRSVETVYDLEVDGVANYFVGGICVHNTLYRFAGATPEVNLYQGFEERYLESEGEGPQGVIAKAKAVAKELLLGDTGPGTVKLTVNYRSTERIVEAINRLIAHNYQNLGGPYDEAYRKELVARPDAPEGDPVSWAWFPNIEAESQSVADGIIEHLAQGGQPGDIFVGTRTRAQLGYLEGPLVRAQVPFVNITGGSFWTSKHVADVVAYVRLAYTALYGRGDKDAFLRVYRIASNYMTVPWKKSPQYGEYANHRFLGRKFLADCRESYEGAQYLASNWRYKAGVKDLVTFVQEIQADLAHAPNVGQVIQYVIEECYQKYLAHEEGTGEAEATEDGKLDDLGTVVDVARRFEDVDTFLAHVDEMVRAAQAVKDKDWSDYVVLSTVHRLKGLERPVVFGPGWAEGYDEETGAPRGLLPHTFSLTPPPQNGPLPGGGIGRIEDERCIAFVLVSRAKSEVYLSGCAQYRSYTFQPSRFAEELGIVAIDEESTGVNERAVTDESTMGLEQASADERPDDTEQAVAEESTNVVEQVVVAENSIIPVRAEQGTSTVVDEQAILLESTVNSERADGIERPVSQEQATDVERPEDNERVQAETSTVVPERAEERESTDPAERADNKVSTTAGEQAKVPESTDVIEQASRDETPNAEE